ncbi:hypothetical protein C8R45DRAFT_1100556 [Mycena sanguinolenta]|nr:hypothetical protein C8R45DRAFT_1100556 [Mycena sanguinolenta]
MSRGTCRSLEDVKVLPLLVSVVDVVYKALAHTLPDYTQAPQECTVHGPQDFITWDEVERYVSSLLFFVAGHKRVRHCTGGLAGELEIGFSFLERLYFWVLWWSFYASWVVQMYVVGRVMGFC